MSNRDKLRLQWQANAENAHAMGDKESERYWCDKIHASVRAQREVEDIAELVRAVIAGDKLGDKVATVELIEALAKEVRALRKDEPCNLDKN